MNDSVAISLDQLDEWIENVSQCKTLSEQDVKMMCERVRISARSMCPAAHPSPMIRRQKMYLWESRMFSRFRRL